MTALPLGLDGVKIALHMLNFLILMGGLTVLLYKPVLKFINNRQETIKKQLEENAAAKKEAEDKLSEYEQKIINAEKEIDNLHAEAAKELIAEKEAIILNANAKAEEIYNKAKAESEHERDNCIENLQNEVAEVAVKLASNILDREISKEENLKLIDACIKEWIEQ
jgi:F-type H+-transporting ATPase subunit b